VSADVSGRAMAMSTRTGSASHRISQSDQCQFSAGTLKQAMECPSASTRIFYREGGSATAPTILFLHGFLTSSNQYGNLIPLLATQYHVAALDLPGFGLTEMHPDHKYTFDSMADTVEAFLDAQNIKKFAVYMFDYGAPTGLRLALRRLDAIAAIISQNGNAYEEGLSSFWEPLRAF
jgi:pimeloyl-ACP methyl ester carboxylesterase